MDKKKAMGWFIIIVMVLGSAGIIGGGIFGGDDSTVEEQDYKGFKFIKYGEIWQVDLEGQRYAFVNSPADLEGISFNTDVRGWLAIEKVYVGYLPDDTLGVTDARNRISAVLYSKGVIAQQACVEEKGCPDIPLVDCSKPTVILRSGKFGVDVEEQCVTLMAEDVLELEKLAERFLYGLLGVI